MNESSERKKGAILSYLSIIVNTIVQLLYTPFLIHSLGQSEYGLYSIVSQLIGYLTVLDLGFGNAIVVYGSKYHERKEYEKENKLYGMFLIIYFIIGIISAIIGAILFFLTPSIFENSMTDLELHKMKILMIILTFNLALTFPFSIYDSIITSRERFTFKKIMNIISTLLKPIIMIPLLFMGCKSIVMALVITFVNIIIMLSNYFYCKNKIKIKVKFVGIDKSVFKEILSYSFLIFLNQLVDKANWSVDQFILGAVCGTVVTSVYAISSQINNLFINLSTAISGVLLPKVSKMVAQNSSDDKLSAEFVKIGRIQYYFIFLIASGLTLFGKEFFSAWVGKEFVDAYYISLIIIIPLSITLIQNLGISILQAKNLHKFRSFLYVAIAIINVIISIPLAKYYGGVGAAIGTSLSLIIGNIVIMNIYYYKRAHLDIFNFWKNILSMTFPFIIPIIIIILFKNILVLHGYLSVVVYGLIYTLMYFIVSYIWNMNEYEKNTINKILKKIKRVKRC